MSVYPDQWCLAPLRVSDILKSSLTDQVISRNVSWTPELYLYCKSTPLLMSELLDLFGARFSEWRCLKPRYPLALQIFYRWGLRIYGMPFRTIFIYCDYVAVSIIRSASCHCSATNTLTGWFPVCRFPYSCDIRWAFWKSLSKLSKTAKSWYDQDVPVYILAHCIALPRNCAIIIDTTSSLFVFLLENSLLILAKNFGTGEPIWWALSKSVAYFLSRNAFTSNATNYSISLSLVRHPSHRGICFSRAHTL